MNDRRWQAAWGALLASACALAGQTRESSTIPVSRVREAVDVHNCAVWSAEARMWSLELLGTECVDNRTAPDAVGAVVALAVRDTQPLILFGDRAYDSFYARTGAAPGIDKRAADDVARAAFWDDPLLADALFLRLDLEFSARKLRCEGCPTVARPPRLDVTWQQFFPYLSAYVWPHELGPGGELAIHVCSGINGLGELPATPVLQQAGFLAAAALADDPARSEDVQRLIREHNRMPRRSVAELRRALDAFLHSPSHRAQICAAVARTAWFTGVVITDCVSA